MVGTGKPVWEPEMVEFLRKIVKPGWTVISVRRAATSPY